MSIPVGLNPGRISKTINQPSGTSIFDNEGFEIILQSYKNIDFPEVPSVLIGAQGFMDLTLGTDNISEIAICEKDYIGYCISQESLKTAGYLLNNEQSQGKYLSPSMCVLDCKIKGYEVNNIKQMEYSS